MEKVRQQRRASLKASLHLQTLSLQRGSGIDVSARQQSAASNATGTGGASASDKDRLIEAEGDKQATKKAQPSRIKSARAIEDALRGDYSEQMLPKIAAHSFKYAGGKEWFLLRRTKQFYNYRTKVTLNTLPSEVKRHSGGEEALPVEILRLEVLRRDRERFHVATQVNRAIDMLMDKLDNDDFAASVFTKEAALQTEHRQTVDAEERKKIVTLGMFHYFDKDHSREIDKIEFRQGIDMLIRDARRTAEESDDLEERAAARRSVDAFERLTVNDLNNVFASLAGADGIAQMDEFFAFYQSKNGKIPSVVAAMKVKAKADAEAKAEAEADKSSAAEGDGEEFPSVVVEGDDKAAAVPTEKKDPAIGRLARATKTVWTLLRESEDVLLARGRLDEIAAEQRLVEQTYEAMRDKATKTHRKRFPPFTSQRIPYSIMPDSYLRDLAAKEAKLAQQEDHFREVLAGLEEEGDAIEVAMQQARRLTMDPGSATASSSSSSSSSAAGRGGGGSGASTTATTVVPNFCERLRRCLCSCGPPYRKMSDASADNTSSAAHNGTGTGTGSAATMNRGTGTGTDVSDGGEEETTEDSEAVDAEAVSLQQRADGEDRS